MIPSCLEDIASDPRDRVLGNHGFGQNQLGVDRSANFVVH